MQDNVLITFRIVWSNLVTSKNINHHLGLSNLYNIHDSALSSTEAQIYVLWQFKKGAEKKDKMVVVFLLHKKSLFIPCSYFIQEVKS